MQKTANAFNKLPRTFQLGRIDIRSKPKEGRSEEEESGEVRVVAIKACGDAAVFFKRAKATLDAVAPLVALAVEGCACGPPRSTQSGHRSHEELNTLKFELRLAKARATAVGAEIDVNVLNAGLRALSL